jgi:hypothetical protein
MLMSTPVLDYLCMNDSAVDCIDCAADASIVNAVNEGIGAAREIVYLRKPWVMISVNDYEDLHFRKAGTCSLI